MAVLLTDQHLLVECKISGSVQLVSLSDSTSRLLVLLDLLEDIFDFLLLWREYSLHQRHCRRADGICMYDMIRRATIRRAIFKSWALSDCNFSLPVMQVKRWADPKRRKMSAIRKFYCRVDDLQLLSYLLLGWGWIALEAGSWLWSETLSTIVFIMSGGCACCRSLPSSTWKVLFLVSSSQFT